MRKHQNGISRAAKIHLAALAAVFGVVAALTYAPAPSMAVEVESSLARGGRLYDKWYKVIKAKAPEKAHPAYPADRKYAAKPKANWRCKECHGWDYSGKDGAYSKGKHSTGIIGINGAFGRDPSEIVALLKDETHGYTDEMMDPADFEDLALFVSMGQFDMDEYIDRSTGDAKGDSARGEPLYATLCAGCHGFDGMKIKGVLLGKEAQSNPWETLHKMMNGQPAEVMPPQRAVDRQNPVDILAYLRTLPTKK